MRFAFGAAAPPGGEGGGFDDDADAAAAAAAAALEGRPRRRRGGGRGGGGFGGWFRRVALRGFGGRLLRGGLRRLGGLGAAISAALAARPRCLSRASFAAASAASLRLGLPAAPASASACALYARASAPPARRLLHPSLLRLALALALLLVLLHRLLRDERAVRVLAEVVILRRGVQRRVDRVEVGVVAQGAPGGDVRAARRAVMVPAGGEKGGGGGEGGSGEGWRGGGRNSRGRDDGRKDRAGFGRHAQLAEVLLDALAAEAVKAGRHHLDLLHRAPAHGAPRVMAHGAELHRERDARAGCAARAGSTEIRRPGPGEA